jgi:transposase-like protein
MDGACGNGPLGGEGVVIEADETFVGGKAKNRMWNQPIPKKHAVVALVERDGRARSFHVANVHANTLKPILYTNVDRSSKLMTDEYRGYVGAGREFASHDAVNHSRFEYVRGDKHTNTVEGFFSIFKRGVIGTYHHMSEAHLGRYCREFDLRYSTRDITDGERASLILKGMEGRRLTYRRTCLAA